MRNGGGGNIRCSEWVIGWTDESGVGGGALNADQNIFACGCNVIVSKLVCLDFVLAVQCSEGRNRRSSVSSNISSKLKASHHRRANVRAEVLCVGWYQILEAPWVCSALASCMHTPMVMLNESKTRSRATTTQHLDAAAHKSWSFSGFWYFWRHTAVSTTRLAVCEAQVHDTSAHCEFGGTESLPLPESM